MISLLAPIHGKQLKIEILGKIVKIKYQNNNLTIHGNKPQTIPNQNNYCPNPKTKIIINSQLKIITIEQKIPIIRRNNPEHQINLNIENLKLTIQNKLQIQTHGLKSIQSLKIARPNHHNK